MVRTKGSGWGGGPLLTVSDSDEVNSQTATDSESDIRCKNCGEIIIFECDLWKHENNKSVMCKRKYEKIFTNHYEKLPEAEPDLK